MQQKTLNATIAEAVWIAVGFDAVLILSIFALDSSAYSVFLAVVAGVLLGVGLAYMVFNNFSRAQEPAQLLQSAEAREYANQQQLPTKAEVREKAQSPQPTPSVKQSGVKRRKGVLDVW